MSKAQLKKHLLKLTQEEVIDVILELYDARKEAKEYLEFYMNPNDDIKLDEYKKIIYNEYMISTTNINREMKFHLGTLIIGAAVPAI